jgi:hypothetical protein
VNFGKRRSRTRAYDFREEDGLWTVYECESGRAAVLHGVPQTGLGLNEADDLAAVLNRVAIQQVTSRIATAASGEMDRIPDGAINCGGCSISAPPRAPAGV